jgi:hypothetical protein
MNCDKCGAIADVDLGVVGTDAGGDRKSRYRNETVIMNPLLRLIATQPQLLADHAQAYGELVVAELGNSLAVWKRSAVLHAAAL